MPTDVGRPISDLRIGVNIPDLNELISSVTKKAGEVTREVQSENGRWYWLRICPFRTAEQKIDGVLIAFFDINALKQKQALQEERDFVSAILDAAQDLLVMVLDPEGRIVQFNRVCQELSGYSIEEARGRHPWDFLVPPQEIVAVEKTFKEVLGGAASQTACHWITKDGRRLLIGWSNSPAIIGGSVRCMIASGVDQTEHAEARQKAQESQATVQALLETASQAILAIDQHGRIVLANAATEKMFGYGREELINQNLGKLIPEQFRQQHANHIANWFLQPCNRRMGTGLKLCGVRKDGTEFPADISLSYMQGRDGVLGVAFVSDITDRKRNEELLLDYQKRLQKLTANLLTVQEAGNQDLARELHDVFSQELAALNMELSTLQPSKASDPLGERLAELAGKIGRLAEQMHDTARRLHPQILHELGLETALREQCDAFSRQSGIPLQFGCNEIPVSLPEDVSLCLYRVAQEALLNIRKHSGATEVRVQVHRESGGIRLVVEDTGDGFDLNQARKSGGLGLIGMEERVRLVDGNFSIRSQPGLGTTVEVFIPINEPRA
jgi:PAS domain S-box-containing protein